MNKQYLQAMDIDLWQMKSLDFFPAFQAPQMSLPAQYRLLIITPQLLAKDNLPWLAKVLTTLKIEGEPELTLEHVCLLPPDDAQCITEHQLSWLWYAGCEPKKALIQISEAEHLRQLTTPSIDKIPTKAEYRQQLWQQIQQVISNSQTISSSNK